MATRHVLVGGAGGAIGGHLVRALLEDGHEVHAVDIKPLDEWWQVHGDALNFTADLSDKATASFHCMGQEDVYDLAADMGGMGFIENHKLDCMLSVLIGVNMLQAACRHSVERFFFSSSACVYASYMQEDEDNKGLRESDAYPADPEDGYGWEKLFTERLCRHFDEETPMSVRIARYHNVYGPYGTWRGGREKAPAALCRKVAEAKLRGFKEIEVWGDGKQTRSFMFVDDCVDGTLRLMASDTPEPLNLGSEHLVSIDELADIIQRIAGTHFRIRHVEGPMGVRGRNSDNTRLREAIGWEPSTSLEDGLEVTYRWIYDQVRSRSCLIA